MGTKAIAAAKAKQRKTASAKPAKATKAIAKVREGWKTGTPKAADGTTGTNACLCGCGTKVKRLFAQGHDARVHGWLLAVEREERTKSSLPEITQRALASGLLVVHASQPQNGTVISPKAAATLKVKPAAPAKAQPAAKLAKAS
jgi:hypothetical protein